MLTFYVVFFFPIFLMLLWLCPFFKNQMFLVWVCLATFCVLLFVFF